ncbi:gamma-glutamylcyclotransferase family protein [Novosphingobium terrae]|uniref:gamma-glutamylcyclotransferase family protein n=1 Tax=Novosphingobium terrae TaxID=2726189 RepID=UPI00197E1884|nr:gamma-glutamylcyclotransferase family protein [Novosphingobium terrae]
MEIDHRLATYGTLAPGRPNHHQLSMIEGRWSVGFVRGRLVDQGWGAALGYPALVPGEDGDRVEVHLFEAAGLAQHWPRLDAFEGAEYRRAPITVETGGATLDAWIYINA